MDAYRLAGMHSILVDIDIVKGLLLFGKDSSFTQVIQIDKDDKIGSNAKTC